MSKKTNQAIELFPTKFNCSQTTLGVFAEELGVDFKKATDMATGFGAGLAYQGKTCGAVTGAYMAIGLISGTQFNENEMVKENTLQWIRKFNEYFISKYGSVECKHLIGYDLGIPEELEKAREEGVFTKKCSNYVEEAIKFIEEYMLK